MKEEVTECLSGDGEVLLELLAAGWTYFLPLNQNNAKCTAHAAARLLRAIVS
jgi:hypothetical protein